MASKKRKLNWEDEPSIQEENDNYSKTEAFSYFTKVKNELCSNKYFQCPCCHTKKESKHMIYHLKKCITYYEEFISQQDTSSENFRTDHKKPQIIRCLLQDLPFDTTGTDIKEFLEKQNFEVKFANMKVPSLESLQNINREDYGSYIDMYTSKQEEEEVQENGDDSTLTNNYTFLSSEEDPFSSYAFASRICYVELETNDEQTCKKLLRRVQFRLFPLSIKFLSDKQPKYNFTHPLYSWYPDVMSVILSFFHSPPSKLPFTLIDNSYITLFCQLARYNRSVIPAIQDSFYCLKFALSIEGTCLQYVDKQYQCKEIVYAAMSNDTRVFKYISKDLLDNEDVVFHLVGECRNEEMFRTISKRLQHDTSFLLKLLHKNETIMKYIDASFKDNNEFALAAVKQNGRVLGYLNPILKADKLIAYTAMVNGAIFKALPSILQKDREFVLSLAKENCSVLRYCCFQDDKEIVLAAVKNRWCNDLQFVSITLRKDKEFMLQVLSQSYGAYRYVADSLKKDKEIALLAVMKDGLQLRFLDLSFINDKDVVLAAVKNNGQALQYTTPELKNNREVVIAAIKNNKSAFNSASAALKKDPEILELYSEDSQ